MEITPREVVDVAVTMDWTLEEFYDDGGVDAFAARVAVSLNVDVTQVKVVHVYEGSVVVNFIVLPLDDDSDEESTVAVLTADLQEQMVDGVIDIGAPIIASSGTSSADAFVWAPA